jgi:hypothetical protein
MRQPLRRDKMDRNFDKLSTDIREWLDEINDQNGALIFRVTDGGYAETLLLDDAAWSVLARLGTKYHRPIHREHLEAIANYRIDAHGGITSQRKTP